MNFSAPAICPLCEQLIDDGEPRHVFSYNLVEDVLAHPSCLADLATAIREATTVEDLRDCVDRYYAGNAAGGSLHIVLDDYNYDDDDVRACIAIAEEGWVRDGQRTPPDTLGAALGRKLLALCIEDRAAANDATACKHCGHAMSLHHWESPDGTWGYSSTGKCRSATCLCADGQPAAAGIA